jgi:iron(III) transport system permease protein
MATPSAARNLPVVTVPLWLRLQLQRSWDGLRRHRLSLGITALLLWVVGAPIVFLLSFSIRRGSPVNPGELTIGNYTTIFTNSLTGTALVNTLVYAGVVSVVGLTLAALFAWFIERTDMPGRGLAWGLMLLPLAMPGMLASMAWILMLSPKIGLINLLARGGLDRVGVHLTEGPFDIYTLGGMIFIESIRGSTTLFLMMVGAFRLMDPALEEAAATSGASRLRSLRHVTLGLMLPGLLAAAMYSFLGNLDDFETPLLVGLPANVFVLPTLIYFTAYQGLDFGLSAAYSSLFMVVTVVMVVVYYRVVLRNAERFSSVTGKGFRPRRLSLGRWRYGALGLFGLYALFAIGLPLFVLAWASILPSYQVPTPDILGKIGLTNYVTVFSDPSILKSMINTIVLATLAASATMGLAIAVSWIVVRLRVRGGAALDAIAFIPHAIPTAAVGLALVVFYLNPIVRWLPIYGTVWIMVLALMTRYLAFATRTSNAAMTQIGKELEEQAAASGAGHGRTLRRVTFPLLLPAFIAGWIWVFAHTFRNLTIPLMLATPGNDTIATTLYNYWDRKADFSLASALGVIILAMMALTIVLARRLVVRGYTRDG